MRFHSASLLLVWGCMLLLLQILPFHLLLPVTFMVMVTALILSKSLCISMLRRARWLFLTLMVLFSTMTPGVFVPAPWNFGFITQEGLLAAAEHSLRLAAMLSLLAVLLDTLDQSTIVAGLYVLLRPLTIIGIDRERISVRLLLVLDHVAVDRRDWRRLLHMPASSFSTGSVRLSAGALRARDIVMASIAVAATILGWLRW